MANRTTEVSPAATAIIVIVVLIAIVAGGIWYMNRPKSDAIAAEVNKARGGASAPIEPGAPMGGVAPKPGPSDYVKAAPIPQSQTPARH